MSGTEFSKALTETHLTRDLQDCVQEWVELRGYGSPYSTALNALVAVPKIRESLSEKLGWSIPVTVDELTSAWTDCMAGCLLSDFDSSYAQFVRQCEQLVSTPSGTRQSQPFAIASGWVGTSSRLEQTLAVSGNVSIDLVGALPDASFEVRSPAEFDMFFLAADIPGSRSLYARVSAVASLARLGQMVSEIQQVIGSLFRIARYGGFSALPGLIRMHGLDEDQPTAEESDVFSFVKWGVECFLLGSAANKKAYSRRISAALNLVRASMDSKWMEHSIALKVCAMESLLGEKSESGISDELSRRVAALMTDDATSRPGLIERMKKLYGLRSKLLHGEIVKLQEPMSLFADLVLSNIFVAAYEWREFSRRMGEGGDSSTDFLGAIKNAEMTGKAVIGVKYTRRRLRRPADSM